MMLSRAFLATLTIAMTPSNAYSTLCLRRRLAQEAKDVLKTEILKLINPSKGQERSKSFGIDFIVTRWPEMGSKELDKKKKYERTGTYTRSIPIKDLRIDGEKHNGLFVIQLCLEDNIDEGTVGTDPKDVAQAKAQQIEQFQQKCTKSMWFTEKHKNLVRTVLTGPNFMISTYPEMKIALTLEKYYEKLKGEDPQKRGLAKWPVISKIWLEYLDTIIYMYDKMGISHGDGSGDNVFVDESKLHLDTGFLCLADYDRCEKFDEITPSQKAEAMKIDAVCFKTLVTETLMQFFADWNDEYIVNHFLNRVETMNSVREIRRELINVSRSESEWRLILATMISCHGSFPATAADKLVIRKCEDIQIYLGRDVLKSVEKQIRADFADKKDLLDRVFSMKNMDLKHLEGSDYGFSMSGRPSQAQGELLQAAAPVA